MYIYRSLILWCLLLPSFIVLLVMPSPYLFAQESTPAHINGVAWHSSGKLLAVAADDGVQLVDETGQPVQILIDAPLPATSVAWSPDGSVLVATTASAAPLLREELRFGLSNIQNQLLVWDCAIEEQRCELNQTIVYPEKLDDEQVFWIDELTWNQSTSQFALMEHRWSGSMGELFLRETIAFWDIDTWKRTSSVDGFFYLWSIIALNSNSTFMALLSNPNKDIGALYLINTATSEITDDEIIAADDVDWFGTNELALAAFQIFTIHVSNDGEILDYKVYRGEPDPAGGFAYSETEWMPDGKYLLALTAIGRLEKIDTETMQGIILGYVPRSGQMKLDPSGQRLALFSGNQLFIQKLADFVVPTPSATP